jgi:hypothetical protein
MRQARQEKYLEGVLVELPEERHYLLGLGVDRRVILQWILKKLDGRPGLDCSG